MLRKRKDQNTKRDLWLGGVIVLLLLPFIVFALGSSIVGFVNGMVGNGYGILSFLTIIFAMQAIMLSVIGAFSLTQFYILYRRDQQRVMERRRVHNLLDTTSAERRLSQPQVDDIFYVSASAHITEKDMTDEQQT